MSMNNVSVTNGIIITRVPANAKPGDYAAFDPNTGELAIIPQGIADALRGHGHKVGVAGQLTGQPGAKADVKPAKVSAQKGKRAPNRVPGSVEQHRGEVLNCLRMATRPLNAEFIAKMTGLSRSAVHAHLRTLEVSGNAKRDTSSKTHRFVAVRPVTTVAVDAKA